MPQKIGIVDCSFPKAKRGFRDAEIRTLLDADSTTTAYSAYPMSPGPEAFFTHSYGMTKKDFKQRRNNYLKQFPKYKNRIKYLPKHFVKPFLAMSYFLSDTYTYLPYFEKHQIPFIFILYPGGGFGLNNPSSDAMLRKIFSSKYFRKVIATQDVTARYLREKKLLPPSKIEMLWGGMPQLKNSDFSKKLAYPKDKATIDILFQAYKYSEGGKDKGYDIFIAAAKKVHKENKKVIFHVVGNFDKSDMDTRSLGDNIIFHGVLSTDKLKKLYLSIDIRVSLSRMGALFPGNFDGFPLANDALVAGALVITTDELDNNGGRFCDDELVIVKPDAKAIADKVLSFAKNPKKMYNIAKKGQKKYSQLVSPEQRLKKLHELFKEIANEN